MFELTPEQILEYGRDCQKGNLLGIQPFMIPLDFASQDSFYSKLNHYLHLSAQKGWINERTIAVFPEYIGTWLVAAGEKPGVYHSKRLDQAMFSVAFNHSLSLARTIISATEKEKIKAGLFRVKSKLMAQIYQDVFSQLAKKYHCTLVGGSIVLPAPQIKDGVVMVTNGPLYNVSVIYRPDGSADPKLVRKVFPIMTESTFIARASLIDLPVFDTPAGKLGVLICADAWYPASYERLMQLGVDIIAVPSYISGQFVWDNPWEGYNGAPTPGDVNQDDIGRITEGQAWDKYALSRISQTNARYGINVSINGILWDLGCDGRSSLIQDNSIVITSSIGPAILNLWLS